MDSPVSFTHTHSLTPGISSSDGEMHQFISQFISHHGEGNAKAMQMRHGIVKAYAVLHIDLLIDLL